MASEEKYTIWFNEARHPFVGLFSNLAEKVAYGGYASSITGTRKEVTAIYRKLLKKPCLAEKYIKTDPE